MTTKYFLLLIIIVLCSCQSQEQKEYKTTIGSSLEEKVDSNLGQANEYSAPDIESLEFWTADIVLQTNRELVTLMSPLYQYVYADSLSSLIFEKDLKWMNEYRNNLCRYYNANELGADTISPYAKADAVIEASRKLWKLDSDYSTMGMNVKNGVPDFITFLKFSHEPAL